MEDLSKLKSAEITRRLKKRGLSTSGKKADKIERLQLDEGRSLKRQKVSASGSSSSPKKAKSLGVSLSQQAHQLFDQYRDVDDEPNGEDVMTDDSIIKFFDALELDISDLIVLVLSWQMNAKNMCVYTREEFTHGCERLGCGTIPKLKRHLPALSAQLFDPESFQEFYTFVYKYACEDGKKTIPTEMALELWKLGQCNRCSFLS
jgi:hypothetical protein